MKTFLKLFFVFLLTLPISSAFAGDVYVNGYTKSNGTYVQPHYRSAPDGNSANNWTTRGNVNPYTGSVGTRDPSPSMGSGSWNAPVAQPSYGSGLGTNMNSGTGNSLNGSSGLSIDR